MPDAERVGVERAFGELRGDGQHRAAGSEEREAGRDKDDERARDQPVAGRPSVIVGSTPEGCEQPVGGGVRIESVLGDLGERGPRGVVARHLAKRIPEAVRQDRPHLRLRPREAGLAGRAARGRLPAGSPMAVQGDQQLVDALAGGGGGHEDVGALRARPVGPLPRPDLRARPGDEHRAELRRGAQRAGPVALVDHDEVGHLEEPRLDRLDLVAHLGRLEHDRRVGGGRDLDLALAGPDRLDEDEVEAGGVHHRGRGRGRRGKPAGVAARRPSSG